MLATEAHARARGRRRRVLPDWVVVDLGFTGLVESHVSQLVAQLPATASAFDRLAYAKMAIELMGRRIERESRARPLATEPAWQAHWLSAVRARASSLRGDVRRVCVVERSWGSSAL